MDWHTRYLQQAGWTSELRSYLLRRAGVSEARRVLEVGCGTGAVLKDVNSPTSVYGLDIDPKSLRECSANATGAILTMGDARNLPFPNQSFDLVFCHYFLMWISNPVQAILEMKRITVHGGSILAFAEPDYSKRESGLGGLQKLGEYQTEALIQQGADPTFGASLMDRFAECGIQIVEAGMIDKPKPSDHLNPEDWMKEWTVLENDLKNRFSAEKMHEYKKLYETTRQVDRTSFGVPTYFAWGRVSKERK